MQTCEILKKLKRRLENDQKNDVGYQKKRFHERLMKTALLRMTCE
mgnify:CR=1 FL=1